MSDPQRSEAARASGANGANAEPDRNAKIEELLLAGLDHYFAAEYEQAINVWSRALFLDRTHARARAYIERARGALAERQRESEELLQNGLAAFRRRDGDEARRLLEAAITQGAPRDEALAVLDRLDRLERGTPAAASATARQAERNPLAPHISDDPPRRRRVFVIAGLAAAGITIAGLILSTSSWAARWRSLLALEPSGAQTPALSSAAESPLPLPLRGETALARARTLAARGRLHDALVALDAVKATDAEKQDADALRAQVQQQLLSLAAAPLPSASVKGGGPLP
jgi:hypothetical protein